MFSPCIWERTGNQTKVKQYFESIVIPLRVREMNRGDKMKKLIIALVLIVSFCSNAHAYYYRRPAFYQNQSGTTYGSPLQSGGWYQSSNGNSYGSPFTADND